MEIVIPPRDHGPSTYRYTWDENGEVQQVTRVRDESSSPERRLRRGRQTVQWPFQSIATETEISGETAISGNGGFGGYGTYQYGRPITWQPKGASDSDSNSIDRDLIPDYVRNYIRGETPETVARRKRNGGKLGERGVDVAHQHRPHQSRVAEIEGFRSLDETPSRLGSSHDGDDQRRILSGCNEKPERGWRRLTAGWRAGVASNVLFAFSILVLGVVFLIYALSRGSGAAGKSIIYSGSCARASAINWGLHAAINFFVVVLLAGANYVFQVLSSPTRTEVAVAHFRRNWLDIGIPSFRNLAHIDTGRGLLVAVILTTAALTQIMYNAVVLTTQTVADYKLVLATESFLTGSPFSNDTFTNRGLLSRIDIASLQQQANRGELVNLTSSACFQEFGGAFSTNFDSALLISNLNSQTSSVIQTSVGSSLLSGVSAGSSVADLTRDRSSIKFCLAQPARGQTCEIGVSGPLLGAVAFLNVITVLSIASVLLRRSFEPLATLGDAIVSFLKEPDTTTRGCCLLSKTDVWQGRWGLDAAKYWVPHNHYWFRTPSLPRWLAAIFVWLCCVGCAAAALTIALLADPSARLSPFGSASAYTIVMFPTPTPETAMALIASFPQLLLASLYLIINSILTTYHLSHESSLFAVGPARPLRVSSDPEGAQTASLYLTLPRPASWLLLVLFAGMGFVLSQAVFPVSIQLANLPITTTATATTPVVPATAKPIIALGFSGVALLVFLSTLVLLAISVVGLGFRRAPEAALVNGQPIGNPMTLPSGSCSAVISARCHAQASERELWRKNLVWGTVREGVGMDVSHCTFTAGLASQLDVSKNYA